MKEKLDNIIEQNKYIIQQNDAILIMIQGIMMRQGFSEEDLEYLRKHTEKIVKSRWSEEN